MQEVSVICADDDEEMCALYTAYLSPRNYNVRTVTNGQAALEEFDKSPADLMILDIDMPRKSGLAVCRQLRKSAASCAVPIIIVSSHESEEAIVNAITSGADDYIIKPLKSSELLAKATTVLRKRKETVSNSLGLPLGSCFAGRYMVREKLGSGGFSSVYMAEDTSLAPPLKVALKVFKPPPGATDHEYPAVFLREAYSLSKLQHRNIMKFHDFGQSHHSYFIATEFFTGRTLRQILDKLGPVAEVDAAVIGAEIIAALEYMERFNVVHRDITPNNIMIVDGGDTKLIDFGLAKQVEDETLTPEGMFTGTPQYMAPEIITLEGSIDTRADIFSLGATLFTLVTNKNPYSGRTPMDVLQSRYNETPPNIFEVNNAIGVKLSNLIRDMMQWNLEERPTVQKIRATLAEIIVTNNG